MADTHDLGLELPLHGVNLVEASAGTGKTFVLATLYARAVIEARLPVDALLAVTFTVAATDELRTRIRERLTLALRLVDGEPVGELAPIVGQDRVHRLREVGDEAAQECSRRSGIALAVDLQIDVAGGAVDRDIGIALDALEGRQVLEIDMDEAHAGLLERADRRLVRRAPRADPVPFETAVNGTA